MQVAFALGLPHLDYTGHKKVAFYKIFSVLRPQSLCTWLKSDLELSYYDLKALWMIMAHAIKLSTAFQ